MDEIIACNCKPNELMIFPCAGACNVGQLSNDLAKRLSNNGIGKMACIAAVGAGGIMAINAVKGAKIVLILDGCPIGCAKKIVEKNGITIGVQVLMTSIGMKKTDNLSYDDGQMEKAYQLIIETLKNVGKD